MEYFKIKSIRCKVHDTSFGGYPYKVMVEVEIDSKVFNKVCKKIGESKHTLMGFRPAPRDLGNLVLDVGNWVYSFNRNIPTWNPMVDASKRATKGIKAIEFTYFFKDHDKAEALGLEVLRFKNGEACPKYGAGVTLLSVA